MIHRRTLVGAGLGGLALSMPALRARAQASWPNKPIRVVVGFAAGGATDISTRVMQPKLSALLGQPVVIENRPGAGGNIATEVVVHAQPDGHAFLMGTIGALAINPTLYGNLPFNPQTDLTPVAMAGNVLNVLVVPADRPWRNVADLIEAAKKDPDGVTYGSSGVGGAGHLAGALLDRMAGVKTVHVPYRGGGPLMTDLTGGKIDYAFSTAPTALPQVQNGRLRLLAVPTLQRVRSLPDKPTVAETLPGYEVQNWYALVGPKGLSPAIVTRMNAVMREALADPTVASALEGQGVEPIPSSPEELARFIREEATKWAPIVRSTGARAE
ncbi:Bug family tripartite tricarboxylate transporter substrate binding protein [Roseomonas xinghualingensis]|uniref:Bug family tripartite tricarboxylate transporter substrate binding protein n=1 Tax=Roseomonas xinghualingensis TaxID=2986475 RepID=UPI0021F1606F|nr:tripartite tricarboxylate transporter substrate binding protein [Roseomonas sp. SXEYE001]MCV4206622.1 tripartite tricarboxylate transporter substrate binding protein [Roseomonas sp. SXEYE001]